MRASTDLLSLLGEPRVKVPKAEWSSIEGSLGCALPEDYKNWASVYSSMRVARWTFVENFAIEYSLFGSLGCEDMLSGVRYVNSRRAPDTVLTSYDEATQFPLKAGELRFYPEPGGMLYWGQSELGDYFGWVTGPDPEAWTTFATDGAAWWHFDGGFSDFLISVMTKRIACPLLEIEQDEEVVVEEMLMPKWRDENSYSTDFAPPRIIDVR